MSSSSSTGAGLGVSVWEVVEARGGPLTEHETWAILAAAATTVQDNSLSGNGNRLDVVTPEGLILLRCGRVDLLATPPNSHAHPHGNYLPPEAFTNDLHHQHHHSDLHHQHQHQQDGERLLVFSLGRTLWAAAEHSNRSNSSTQLTDITHTISSSLRSTLSAMTHNLPAHRLTLVDIFQLLVERLNGPDRLNYTATIRSLYEEVLGPPLPPPQPPDPVVVRRHRSYSALDARTSTGRRPTSLSWSSSRRSTSVEDLSHHQYSLGPVKFASVSRTPSTNVFPTMRGRDVIRMSSMQDISLLAPSFRTSSRLSEDIVLTENIPKSLIRSKKNFHSMDTINSSKENVIPRLIEGNDISSLGGTMNPILEVSSTEASPVKTSPKRNVGLKAFPYKESRTTITVSRSATVAGVMKGEGLDTRPGGGASGTQKKIPPKKPPRSRAMSVDNLLNTEAELRQNLCEVVQKKRRIVVRTPSRLYRFADGSPDTVVGPTSAGTPPILGPEFVVRSKEPAKVLTLLQDAQRGVVKKVTVILVTGRRLELTCDPSTTRVTHILQAVFQEEDLPLKHLLGLAVLGSGEFHFVAPQTKLHKVAPPGWRERHPTKDGLIQDNFTLHLRIMYYLKFSNLSDMARSSRQLLYLQLRHDVLEGRLSLPPDVLFQLASLALQAEFGDKNEQSVGYFLPEHYVPESLLRGGQTKEASQKLQQNHSALMGLPYTQAQARFIATLQDTQHYGAHYYHVTQDKGRQQWWLGIGPEGVLVIGSGPLTSEAVACAILHPWSQVKRLSYTTHRLTVAVRGPDKSTKIKFNLQETRSRHVFYLATVHQSFQHDAAALSQLTLPVEGSGIPLEVFPSHQDPHSQAASSASSATTTARTSLSSAGTADDPTSGGHVIEVPGGTEGENTEAPKVCVVSGAEKTSESTPFWPIVLGGHKSSDSLSRENFLSDILWRGGGDETDEVFSIENLENEQQSHKNQQQEEVSEDEVKASAPRVFHQRSKSNIESSSREGAGATRPELTREFGSDESLLTSPRKGSGVRMGTRVSAAALQKRRLRGAEVHYLPSLTELNTTPTAVVVEPSLRSVVVEESVSDSLVERFLQCPGGGGGCERRLHSITLLKKEGSLGVMIAEGADRGLYIQAVSPGGPAALEGSLKPGDRIVGINGRSVENLPYTAAVDLLRQISCQVTLLVSQPVAPSTDTTPTPTPTKLSQNTPTQASSTQTTKHRITPTEHRTPPTEHPPTKHRLTEHRTPPTEHPPTRDRLTEHRTPPTEHSFTKHRPAPTEPTPIDDSSLTPTLPTYMYATPSQPTSTYATPSQPTCTYATPLQPTEDANDSPTDGSPCTERGQATIRAVGGMVTFAREVRSGPVTVITLNAGTPPPGLPLISTPIRGHTDAPPPLPASGDLTAVPALGITLGPCLPNSVTTTATTTATTTTNNGVDATTTTTTSTTTTTASTSRTKKN